MVGRAVAKQWTDETWSTLLDRIRQERITPLLGAGASIDIVGDAAGVAKDWAREYGYPFESDVTLAEVAQYVAITVDRARVGEYIESLMHRLLDRLVVADLNGSSHVYRWLPRLDLPIWITTNYDDLIERGLMARNKSPSSAMSAWTPPNMPWKATDTSTFPEPTPKKPLVFHLHGSYLQPLSMVITESDYLEFLEQMTEIRLSLSPGRSIIPQVVEEALSSTSLLFIGYGFRDANLQLLLRQWTLPRGAYAVHPLNPILSTEQQTKWMEYYPRYLKAVTGATVTVFWGTASEFCTALDERINGDAR